MDDFVCCFFFTEDSLFCNINNESLRSSIRTTSAGLRLEQLSFFMLRIHQKTLKRFGKDSRKTISSHPLTSKDSCLEFLVTAESQTEVLQSL